MWKTFFSCQTAGKRRETCLSRRELAASAGGSRCQSYSLQASHQQVGTELPLSGCNSFGQRAKTRHLTLQTTKLSCVLTLQQSPGNRLFLGTPHWTLWEYVARRTETTQMGALIYNITNRALTSGWALWYITRASPMVNISETNMKLKNIYKSLSCGGQASSHHITFSPAFSQPTEVSAACCANQPHYITMKMFLNYFW